MNTDKSMFWFFFCAGLIGTFVGSYTLGGFGGLLLAFGLFNFMTLILRKVAAMEQRSRWLA